MSSIQYCKNNSKTEFCEFHAPDLKSLRYLLPIECFDPLSFHLFLYLSVHLFCLHSIFVSPAKHSCTKGSLCLAFVCLCVCLSSSHTFLVVMHSYVTQGTHAFLGMLPLCWYFNWRYSIIWENRTASGPPLKFGFHSSSVFTVVRFSQNHDLLGISTRSNSIMHNAQHFTVHITAKIICVYKCRYFKISYDI